MTHPDYPISLAEKEIFKKYASELHEGKPLSRILGKREFWGFDFFLSPETLDPRPDSETLIEAVLKEYKDRTGSFSFLDLGTGTGCLLISLLKEYPQAKGVGVDVDQEALNTAVQNAINLEVENRFRPLLSSWFENVKGEFDLIISNPPYITEKEYETLDINVKKYDPILALKGGEDGLQAYRIIIPKSLAFLKRGGKLILEIGWAQKKQISSLLAEVGFEKINIYNDLSGHDRILVASRPT